MDLQIWQKIYYKLDTLKIKNNRDFFYVQWSSK